MVQDLSKQDTFTWHTGILLMSTPTSLENGTIFYYILVKNNYAKLA
jgi:hypothetical protein